MDVTAYNAANLLSLADAALSSASLSKSDIVMVNFFGGGRFLCLACLQGRAEIVTAKMSSSLEYSERQLDLLLSLTSAVRWSLWLYVCHELNTLPLASPPASSAWPGSPNIRPMHALPDYPGSYASCMG